ncbi:hypothetical protein PGT21_009692 [Puccinia graminis f. sp. tritici]|uniref:Uncharacterized protein n=1 Tax=Puccinia graminis f. sp. tritici TaxID=56615 RepID=A0A5B0RJD0_PUCGR|nr:hypothetical protein PGT21_009692 [Puccinia graminis f. sp. tritici]KAA1124884.1 hypothetical protein PGTUg99_036405 [Puccinia graminis f. sp. tritici]
MVYWKTVTLILVVCLTVENGLCVPASVKDFPSEGKEVVQSDLEGLNNPVPLELSQTNGEHHAHQASSDMSRDANHDHLGVQDLDENGQPRKHPKSIRHNSVYQHLVGVAEEIKIANIMRELRTQYEQENLMLKQADWNSMIKTATWTKELIKEVIPSRISIDDWATMEEVHEELEVFYDRIETIYGSPIPVIATDTKSLAQPPKPIDLIPKSFLEEYQESIKKLVSILTRPSDLRVNYFHVRVAWTKCILESLVYLYKYKLIPSDMTETFANYLKDPVVLKWLAQESHRIFGYATRYWNNFHHDLNEIEFLQNHPLLSPMADIFGELGGREQTFVVFHRLKTMIDFVYRMTFPMKDIVDTTASSTGSSTPIQVSRQMDFMEKMEKILAKEFLPNHHSNDNDPEESILQGLSEVKDGLLKMKDFLISPVLEPEIDSEVQFHIVRFSFLILDFAQRKYGPKFIEHLGLNDPHDPNTISFKRNFELMRLIGQVDLWRTMFLDYGWFVWMEFDYGRPIPQDAWSNKGSFFYYKLKEAANNYKQFLLIQFDQDPGWKDFLHTNRFFRFFKESWDSEIQNLPWLYVIFKRIIAKKIPGDYSDLPISMFIEK